MTTVTAFGLSLIFSSCTKASDDPVNKSCQTGPASSAEMTDCDFTATLTDAEIATLMHMREEEKVARDVYNKFYELYNMPVFRNIAISEQRHMDAVLNLIVGYGLTDPVADKGPGEFTPAFQGLYDELIA